MLQAIDWAQRQAGDSLTYAVALVYDDEAREQRNPGRGRGLVWLVGMDGNQLPAGPKETETQQRMLARRREPVRMPSADRMPPGVPDPHRDAQGGSRQDAAKTDSCLYRHNRQVTHRSLIAAGSPRRTRA